MGHLRTVGWKTECPSDQSFPFTIPAIRSFVSLDLAAGVTFFAGENGSGKSTMLEGIAAAAGLPTVGGAETAMDETLAAQRRLARRLALSWSKRTRKGFFLRAEDFFGFQRRVAEQQRELRSRLDEVDTTWQESSDYARGLAKGPAAGQLRDIERRYGPDPDARSHGEAFLHLFQDRFVPGGLYLLDEPEAALSPQSQLALLAMLSGMIRRDAQFIIATHSPILLAFPAAFIYSFDDPPPKLVAYDDIEHVRLTRDFLASPERFLRQLGAE